MGGSQPSLAGSRGAAPKVAAYPFTTQEPELGVVEWEGRVLTVIDLPSLVAGAHQGRGLGSDFLRHAERAQVLVYLLDGEMPDLVGQYLTLAEELEQHSGELTEKERIVAVNKADIPEVQAYFREQQGLLQAAAGTAPVAISALHGEGVAALLGAVAGLIPQALDERPQVAKQPRDPSQLVAKEVDSGVRVWKRADGFEVACSRAERIARGSDLNDWRARMQFHRLLDTFGVLKALKEKGVSSGDTVHIGPVELEWR